jgi:hypothetical protein
MNIVDVLIGLTLMNAMPHFVLGVWHGRMLSAFGFGDRKNMLYAFFNFAVALVLFLWRYGFVGLAHNGIFAGALAILLIYFLTGRMWYARFAGASRLDIGRTVD